MPDLHHAQAVDRAVEPWRNAVVAPDGTHHLRDDQPMYAARFTAVQRYHAPGLAPARDTTGAFHIDAEGRAVYTSRLRQTWGFYEDRAAVEGESGWWHILPDGEALYRHRFAWCGNFQEQRCTVRDQTGLYGHIDREGEPAYTTRHLYAGDFREAAAVVRYTADGLCGHVNAAGLPLHTFRFLDLDVFHKGYARARDEHGWFHIDRNGRAAYSERFVAIEAFYNGGSLCETRDGKRVVIDRSGQVIHTIGRPGHP